MSHQPNQHDYQSDRQSAPGAPTLRAVVGSHRIEEELFGTVYDPTSSAASGPLCAPIGVNS